MLRERLINKIKELGFKFHRDAWRVSFFKKGAIRIAIQKRDVLDDEVVASILRQCGLGSKEIAEFLHICRN